MKYVGRQTDPLDIAVQRQLALRNPIINGKMDFDQRNSGTVMALSTTAQYYVDRWACLLSSAGTVYTGRATWLGVGASSAAYGGTTKVLYFQRPSGSSYTGTAKAIQVLESIDSIAFAGKTITLSFLLYGNAGWKGGDITAAVFTSTGMDHGAAQFFAGSASGQASAGSAVLTPASTPTRCSVTATIPSNATQVAVFFQNAGWTGSGANTDLVAISAVQIDVGATATEFEYRHGAVELALCQRYYYRWRASAAAQTLGAGYASTDTQAQVNVQFPVPMRVPPTVVEHSGAASDYAVLHHNSAPLCNGTPGINSSGLASARILLTTPSGSLIPGSGTMLYAPNTNSFIGFSADL